MNEPLICLGEVLMRLSTIGHERLEQAEQLKLTFGGAEANVAAACSLWGWPAHLISKFPGQPTGDAAIQFFRQFGVDLNRGIRGGDRLGLYFLEPGTSVRASKVVYDRAGSAMAMAKPEEFNWAACLSGASWFHTSGITPAIGAHTALIAEDGLKAARLNGITTSLDVNYRSSLWSRETARSVLKKLFRYTDVCIGVDAALFSEAVSHGAQEEAYTLEDYQRVFLQMHAEYGFKLQATTIRSADDASENTIRALIYDGKAFYQTQAYSLLITDRIGSGDAFTAGLIYGLHQGMKETDAAEFGIAAAALKHTIPGDQCLASVEEIKGLVTGKGAGWLKR